MNFDDPTAISTNALSTPDQLEEQGFAIVPGVVTRERVDKLVVETQTVLKRNGATNRSGYAMRHLVRSVQAVKELAEGAAVRKLIETILGSECFVVRSLFCRRREQNPFAKPSRDPFTQCVQFEFKLDLASRAEGAECLSVGARRIPMILVRHPRARRYVLRLRSDGSARVTIPRGGSATEARRFAERNKAWLERELHRLSARPTRSREWLIGTELFFRGELVKVEAGVNGERGTIRFGSEVIPVTDPAADLRPAMERHLWRLAAKELPARVLEYAAQHQLPVRRVTVRNQKSRWGSCSRRGTISLNWRLIQTPVFVQDYMAIHEIMHLREMNHSSRFWGEVERACPDYETAEQWLHQHSSLLM